MINPMISSSNKGPPINIQMVVVQHLQQEQHLWEIFNYLIFFCGNVTNLIITVEEINVHHFKFYTYASTRHLQQSPMHLHITTQVAIQ
ncbi:CLUMA_CG003340, isoform A [Clunio marinus]|uniref:CLUMA_CG003340, isoform A n=1 Tax=Clunio marinus TaxID=568069 RepID=A0A1J1HNJ2_9DIPT|nr:CLUMA_CG003340, isoform A [Clunio marinus]